MSKFPLGFCPLTPNLVPLATVPQAPLAHIPRTCSTPHYLVRKVFPFAGWVLGMILEKLNIGCRILNIRLVVRMLLLNLQH